MPNELPNGIKITEDIENVRTNYQRSTDYKAQFHPFKREELTVPVLIDKLTLFIQGQQIEVYDLRTVNSQYNWKRVCDELSLRGILHFQCNNFLAAEKDFNSALTEIAKFNASLIGFWNSLDKTYAEEALKKVFEGLEVNSHNLGTVLQHLNKHDEAALAFQKEKEYRHTYETHSYRQTASTSYRV